MLTRSLAIGLIIGGTAAGLALGGLTGWTLNGWRLSGQVAKLEGRALKLEGQLSTQRQSIATLTGVNASCTAAVRDVKGAVQGIAEKVEQRTRASRAAMERVEKVAAKHLSDAKDALARPMPAPGGECAALAREAIDYAKRRKATP